MKKSQLKQIITEQVKSLLKEGFQTDDNDEDNNDGLSGFRGGSQKYLSDIIDPKLINKIYDILIAEYHEIGQDYTKSAFFHMLNSKLKSLNESVSHKCKCGCAGAL